MKTTITFLLILYCLSLLAQKPKTSLYESLKLDLTPKKEVSESLKLNKKTVGTKDFIKVKYLEPIDSNYYVWHQTFKEDKVMESVAQSLNNMFIINRPLNITCMECGEANAFYDGKKKELIICYDLFVDMMSKMEKYHNDPDSLGVKIGKAFTFVLYHEIGHAFIDIFNIPITGKEEDAADYFAFYMLGSNGITEGVDACIEGANFFKDMHDAMKTDTTYQRINKEGNIVDALPYWDEHSFSLQRYYSINSLLFGSNPALYWDKINEGFIGYRRPQNAMQEYEKIKNGWGAVLNKHLKK
jgi:hypothetical protein